MSGMAREIWTGWLLIVGFVVTVLLVMICGAAMVTGFRVLLAGGCRL